MKEVSMTDFPTTPFDSLWASYRDANSRCDVLSGDELSHAQDQERDAVLALAKLRAPDLSGVRKKVEALIDMLKLTNGWSDEREMLLASSIARDLARV
jgi:hypothetical protein